MNNERMIIQAKRLYTITGIIQAIVGAGFILIMIGAVLVGLNIGTSFIATTTSISIGNLTLELADGAVTFNQDPAVLITALLAAGIVVGILWYGLRVIRSILAPMREGRPFDTSVSASLRKLGFVVLFGGVVSQICSMISQRILQNNVQLLMDLFKDGVVTHVTYNSSFDLTFILAALALFLLSYIFRYGEELQKQSDETL